ncbi:hypothetical protein KM043_001644 [Ampulex compressa]|nr:hypothetical protein KM043_001644 [Ampulex compressa]
MARDASARQSEELALVPGKLCGENIWRRSKNVVETQPVGWARRKAKSDSLLCLENLLSFLKNGMPPRAPGFLVDDLLAGKGVRDGSSKARSQSAAVGARGRAGRGALPDGDSDSHDGPRGFARVFHSSPPSFQKRFVLSGRAIDERAIAKLARIKKRSERRVAGTGLERDQGAWPA